MHLHVYKIPRVWESVHKKYIILEHMNNYQITNINEVYNNKVSFIVLLHYDNFHQFLAENCHSARAQ